MDTCVYITKINAKKDNEFQKARSSIWEGLEEERLRRKQFDYIIISKHIRNYL